MKSRTNGVWETEEDHLDMRETVKDHLAQFDGIKVEELEFDIV